MAKITNLFILNSSDKTRHYSVATGNGAVADADDTLVTDTLNYPTGSQYTDLTGKKLYVRMAEAEAVADWEAIN